MVERPREIWTRLTVDPLVDRLAPRLARMSWVTPNRVTGCALVLALGAATCFALGNLRLGGALFLARFAADCLDGKVARLQGSGSLAGATLDIAVDVCGITLCAAALSWHLVSVGELPAGAALGLMGSIGIYNWVLAHRKHLAALADAGSGGSAHLWSASRQPLRWWVATCARLNMSAVPWAVEAEIGALGLAPLLLPQQAAPVLLGAVAFYVLATVVNLRRIRHLIGLLDASAQLEGIHE